MVPGVREGVLGESSLDRPRSECLLRYRCLGAGRVRVGVWRWPEQAACGRGEGCAPLSQALRRPRVHDGHL